MSLTPIFDAALADAPRNIWEASNIFPQPAVTNPVVLQLEILIERIKNPLPPLQPAFTDWTYIRNVA